MAANTGRTVSKFVKFLFSDGTGMRSIPVDSINGVGLVYEEVELTAFYDAVKGALPNTPDCQIDITGPFDTTATTGSHTVLSAACGVMTPRSLDVQIGIRQAWDTEPQFGATATATSGFICTSYIVDVNAGKYSAKFRMVPGSTAPAWGTAAEAVS